MKIKVKKIQVAAVIASMLLMAGCAGTGEAFLQVAMGNDPFKNLSAPATIMVSADMVAGAAKNYGKGLEEIGLALDIKEETIGVLTADVAMAASGVTGVSGQGEHVSDEATAAAMTDMNEKLANVKFEELSPTAQNQYESAYKKFYLANKQNTFVLVAMIGLKDKISNIRPQEIVDILAGSRPDLTVGKILAYPLTIGKFAMNLQSSLKIMDQMEQASDFSNARKDADEIVEVTMNKTKTENEKKFGSAPDNSSSKGLLSNLGL